MISDLNIESEGNSIIGRYIFKGYGSVNVLALTPLNYNYPYHFPLKEQYFYIISSLFNPSKLFFLSYAKNFLPNEFVTLKIPPETSAGFIF